jgi:nitrate/TMAO reductase-like tetraheme cytochrome c subunit
MKKGFLVLSIIVSSLISYKVFSDDDEWGERGEHHERSKIMSPTIVNTKYKAECASCHMAYPPGLLPAKSWEKMMGSLDKHFGEDASLDEKTKKEIADFLVKNSADYSNTRRGAKIASSLGGDNTPLRFSDSDYFKRKHHELSDSIYKRKAIGSKSNCVACHSGAESGNFDEDNVHIPKASDLPKKIK